MIDKIFKNIEEAKLKLLIDTRDPKTGRTPLMLAILNEGQYAGMMVKYLLEKGADVNLVDNTGLNALILAIKRVYH